ncbi:MAG: hypothetical protein SGPRY_014211 [Prymnesium sp.]
MAAPPPVTVQGPAVPIDEHARISIRADHPLVEATPMLDWKLAAAACAAPERVSLSHFLALRAFASRRRVSPAAADQIKARSISCMTLALNQGFWNRIRCINSKCGVASKPTIGATAINAASIDVISIRAVSVNKDSIHAASTDAVSRKAPKAASAAPFKPTCTTASKSAASGMHHRPTAT